MTWSGFNDINLAGVEAENGRSTLKPGAHTCRITEAEIKDTKGGGHAVRVVFEEVSGAGKVHDFINVHNKNDQAEEIGKRRLKALLENSNHPNPNRPGDIKSLVGLTVGVHVEQGDDWVDDKGETRRGGGEPRRNGAYFKLPATTGGDSTYDYGTTSVGGRKSDPLDDDIPF